MFYNILLSFLVIFLLTFPLYILFGLEYTDESSQNENKTEQNGFIFVVLSIILIMLMFVLNINLFFMLVNIYKKHLIILLILHILFLILAFRKNKPYKNEKILMFFYYIYFSMLCCFALANLMFFSKFLINLFL